MSRHSSNTLHTDSPPCCFDKMASSTTLKIQFQQSFTPNALRSYLAEFISTFIFVFAVVGSTMASQKMMPDATSDPTSLVVIGIASALGLSSAVYIAAHISGGHANPAVTFGLAIGGHIGAVTTIFYWASQLLGSILACFLLKLSTAGHPIPTHAIAEEMTGFGGAILESVLTFTLVYTVYAVGDTRKGSLGVIGPVAIGFVVGANVLAAGPFTGGSMNPACSFGSALVSGNFKNQAVYWVGPLIGATIAGLLYEHVVFTHSSDSSPPGSPGTVEGPIV
ncbi:hypothetical protein IFM89_024155 [Coptis chinensis]|uniref:Aquaporin TIP5-1 n=1 Tax=Coptis chinensis TaxID=261450 RepID=A0A835IFB9_9MAGN|nr:hypothetical protein IFM89_024155 [Coptis chinensis]